MTKTLIRQGCFEANSSSSHSISISETGDLLDTIYPDSDGTITLNGDEFGWGFEEYSDALTKANYVAQTYEGDNEKAIDMLKVAIMEHTGATDVIIDCKDGHVDHQSVGTAPGSSIEEIKNFLFNPRSILTIDNDNH